MKGVSSMKILGIVLIVFGSFGFILSLMMFGDIGIAAAIGSIGSTLSGIGFVLANKKLKQLGEVPRGN